MTEESSLLEETELLSTKIKRYLIEQIVTGKLPQGERIVESRLAKSLGTSQSPVREALRDLASIGLIEIYPHRGSTVRSPDAKELADVSMLRARLDGYAAELAAPMITPKQIDELQSLVDEMKIAFSAGDMNEFAAADAAFHQVIARSSDNRPLQRVLQQLEPFGRTYVTVLLPDTDLGEIIVDHESILAALQSGNGTESASAASEHQRRMASMIRSDEQPEEMALGEVVP